MKQSLRKTIVLPIQLENSIEEVLINVDWDILEKVERVYNTSAEYVAAQILVNVAHVQRRHVAQILCLWCQGKTKLKQVEITEAVQTADQDQLYRYVGMIQAAVLWSIRGADGKPLITDAQFDQLVNGEDIEQSEDEDPATGAAPSKKPGEKAKKPIAGTSKKRIS